MSPADGVAGRGEDIATHQVISCTGVDLVVSDASVDGVASLEGADTVVAAQAVDRVGAGGTDDDVVTGRSVDGARTGDGRREAEAGGLCRSPRRPRGAQETTVLP